MGTLVKIIFGATLLIIAGVWLYSLHPLYVVVYAVVVLGPLL